MLLLVKIYKGKFCISKFSEQFISQKPKCSRLLTFLQKPASYNTQDLSNRFLSIFGQNFQILNNLPLTVHRHIRVYFLIFLYVNFYGNPTHSSGFAHFKIMTFAWKFARYRFQIVYRYLIYRYRYSIFCWKLMAIIPWRNFDANTGI